MEEDCFLLRGRYKGERLDASSRHSIRVKQPQTLESEELVGSVVVDYFYHAGQFWTAVVPLGQVAELLGQAFNFSKVKTRKGPDGPEKVYDADGVPVRTIWALNHLQTRFRLLPGANVELYPLGSEPSGQPVYTVDDFVYSIEAVGPLGVHFGFRDGLNGSLISAASLRVDRGNCV